MIYAYSDTGVLCPSCQVLAIWTETDTPNVQVTTFARVLIRQHAKTRQRLILRWGNWCRLPCFGASLDIEDLRDTIAPSGQVLAISREAYAANNTAVKSALLSPRQ
jgi:hypothetical protein